MPDICTPRGHEPGTAFRYSLSKNGPDLRLGPHFILLEFACRDGSDEVLVHPALVQLLERIRVECGGRPIHINSAFRTPEYNRRIGGAKQSRHTFGMAADIVVRGMSPAQVYEVCASINPGGLGRYNSFVHVDVEGVGRRF